jgi:hypothetical protein
MAGTISGIDWVSRMPATGTYTATADDATANQVLINTGKANAAGFIVKVLRGGIETSASMKASMTGGVIKVEDNSTTWVVTAGDVINWIAF